MYKVLQQKRKGNTDFLPSAIAIGWEAGCLLGLLGSSERDYNFVNRDSTANNSYIYTMVPRVADNPRTAPHVLSAPVLYFESIGKNYIDSNRQYTCRNFQNIRQFVRNRVNTSLAVPSRWMAAWLSVQDWSPHRVVLDTAVALAKLNWLSMRR